VCDWRDGNHEAARKAFHTVMTDIVEKIGRRNDLYGKAWTATRLSAFLPSSAMRALEKFDRWWSSRSERPTP
jgi:hypothetical protein